ncbi:hypothetical protein SAMN06272739_2059 [Blastococcus haudaquaticus]|uniref:Uncharacterized protein n=1 Tax=Blastococcus haudaquaticus TaxID=1938745 RepID=A0A286GTL5_9ACTN|nr:hypothetical protein SAMN06272739_2059 [Blastococcus haudaquaticus]
MVAGDVDPAWVIEAVAPDPIAGPLGARFLAALADRIGHEPGVLDSVLVASPLHDVPHADIPVREMSAAGPSHPGGGAGSAPRWAHQARRPRNVGTPSPLRWSSAAVRPVIASSSASAVPLTVGPLP